MNFLSPIQHIINFSDSVYGNVFVLRLAINIRVLQMSFSAIK